MDLFLPQALFSLSMYRGCLHPNTCQSQLVVGGAPWCRPVVHPIGLSGIAFEPSTHPVPPPIGLSGIAFEPSPHPDHCGPTATSQSWFFVCHGRSETVTRLCGRGRGGEKGHVGTLVVETRSKREERTEVMNTSVCNVISWVP